MSRIDSNPDQRAGPVGNRSFRPISTHIILCRFDGLGHVEERSFAFVSVAEGGRGVQDGGYVVDGVLNTDLTLTRGRRYVRHVGDPSFSPSSESFQKLALCVGTHATWTRVGTRCI